MYCALIEDCRVNVTGQAEECYVAYTHRLSHAVYRKLWLN